MVASLVGVAQFGDVQRRLTLNTAEAADPDVVKARLRRLERDPGVEASARVIVADPRPVRRIDHQRRVQTGARRNIERRASSGVDQIEVRRRSNAPGATDSRTRRVDIAAWR